MTNFDKFLFFMVIGCVLTTFAMLADFLGWYV